jgi:hypothetical protein
MKARFCHEIARNYNAMTIAGGSRLLEIIDVTGIKLVRPAENKSTKAQAMAGEPIDNIACNIVFP